MISKYSALFLVLFIASQAGTVFGQIIRTPRIDVAQELAVDLSSLSNDYSSANIGKRCCNTHNIYCLDYSGSMSGSSWAKIMAYFSTVSGTSTYASVVGHGGMPFNIPNSQCGYSKTYMTHQLNAALPPTNLDAPYGNTCYDDALNEVMEILAMNFPDNTCIYFFSDGWEQLFNSGLIPVFKAALNQFRKKTTCPVCIRCYETYSSPGKVTNF